ncbi:type VI secretion system baseplate subunit TssK [Massilia sp. CCM 9210]|uniref:type VI secretion system baseplate subunit TssK n=1 Tax=Massilia scottii TaxID=3057166 RepID=UPI002796D8EC|nr:type VI secretion system baseplate subunit TssK [Massilia sp. CCM 9210]MDQ1812075.1 type VI secretion system baseplate subunit TssK [Massilia sp. CCM 9210]
MNDILQLPDPVQWSEGMLLSPQHLQQNDIYWHRQLGHRLGCVTPHYWGVQTLRLGSANPVAGIVAIDALECVLADGTVVQFPGNYAGHRLQADVSTVCKKPGDKAWIWLIVNARSDAAANGLNQRRRFDSLMPINIRDENTGDGDVPVGRLQLRISLAASEVSDTPPQTDCAYPLLQVETDSQHHVHFSAYHPPMLQLAASAFQRTVSLQQQCRDIVQALWDKIRELAGERHGDMPDEHAQANVENERHLAIARGLASVLPALDIACAADDTHPGRLYDVFAHAVGQVAGIGSDPVPLKMAPYDHANCMPQFQAVLRYVDAKLALVNARYYFLPFARLPERDGYAGFARRLPDEAGDEVLVELKRGDDQSEQALADWIGDAHIIAESMREDARMRRMRGAARVLLTAQELKERGLRPGATVMRISNLRIEVSNKGEQDVIQPGQSLLILSTSGLAAPVSLALIAQRQARRADRPTMDAHHAD